MSRLLNIRNVDVGRIEKNIALGSIISTEFCRRIFPLYKQEYIVSSYVKRIINWCKRYFEEYEEAPKKHIEIIFSDNVSELREKEKLIINDFLTQIIDEYTVSASFNVQYIIDVTLKYFKKRELELIVEKGKSFLSKNKIDETERLIRNYSTISKQMSNIVNPFDSDTINKYLIAEDVDSLFKLNGSVGELIGPFRRGWLIGFLAPMKRGKSWWLQEIAVNAVLNNLNTFFVSLEMNEKTIVNRIYARILGYSDGIKEIVFPVFDCLRNQVGACRKKDRLSKVSLATDVSDLPHEFIPVENYVPCDVCRGKKDFIPAVWYEIRKIDKKTLRKKKKILKGFASMFGKHLRIISFPAFSATVDDIFYELDILESTENFVPDVICIDYADILAFSNFKFGERELIDITWKKMKRLADEKHIAVFTASQSNRGSIKKKVVDQIDTAEDIRKIAHVDMMISLNQLPEEKAKNLMRLSLIAHRHKNFNSNKQVMVLQQLNIAQPCIDSEFIVKDIDFM